MNIATILTSKKTIFTIRDLELLLGLQTQVIRNYLTTQKEKNILENIFSGIRIIKGKEYNKYELACKIREKSYVSFETVLQKNGVIFQDYSSIITVASDNTINKQVDKITYQYKKIKDDILLNPIGIEHTGNYSIATKERAICDIIYLKPGFSFDNLGNIDFDKLEKISEIYNKRTILEIKKLKKYA